MSVTKLEIVCTGGNGGSGSFYEIELDKEVDESKKTYLYKEGNEYEELTGGWEVGFIAGDNASVGSVEKKENCIDVKTWGYWCGMGGYTKIPIDITEYQKIRVEIYDCDYTEVSAVSAGYEQVFVTCGSNQKIILRDGLRNGTYMLDISNITGNANMGFYIGNGANGKIRAIWLEK